MLSHGAVRRFPLRFMSSFLSKPSKLILALALVCGAAPVGALAAAAGRENPVPVRTVPPEYPTELKKQRVSGLVVVKCTVDVQGNVSDTNIVKSSNELFDQFALDAVKKWKFKPARQDGTAVASQVSIPIKFVADET
jgi:periplasmic protein TonB